MINSDLERSIRHAEEVVWLNPKRQPMVPGGCTSSLGMGDILDAEARLERFAPLLMHLFPETRPQGGIIESPLLQIPHMQATLAAHFGCAFPGQLLLKQDSHLAVAGSVKARGGIYEVLKHTEELALSCGLLAEGENYRRLAEPSCRAVFSRHTIQVGSTGNLGMSIGIMSAALGYQAVVHMSADARQWKKDLLRSHGVTVVEYASDYSQAVKQGRLASDQDPNSYFVDDENSKNLFLGYAVAALRLKRQLLAQNIAVDAQHPLFVYIPCGVGGAPGGITFGLKQLFGDHVHCFFVEPTQAPCMLVGMASGLHNGVSVQDYDLTGLTHADGLAVGRSSGFVGRVMEPLLSGIFTLQDSRLYDYMRALLTTQDIFIEPSAAAAFHGPITLLSTSAGQEYLRQNNLTSKLPQSTHIAWATGGSLVPEEIRTEYQKTYL